MKQGTEQTTFAYDAKHRLASSTDAAGNAIAYVYDDADRVIEKRLPGNRAYKYTYDADGNVETLTTPRGKVHRSARPATTGRSPTRRPARARTSAPTRPSARWSRTKLPSGAAQADGLRRGRPADVGGPRPEQAHVRLRRRAGPLRHGHAHARGRRRASRRIEYAYDGIMPASRWSSRARRPAATTTRSATGSCRRARSSRWAATEITRALAFDDDRLATKTGPFTIERNGPGGRGLEDHRRQARADVRVRRATAGPATRTLSVGGTERFFQKLTFDNAGRASVARGARRRRRADTLAYGYDGSGQLLTVKRGATVRREQRLRRQRQPARRRRGLRRPRPADRPRRRRLHVGRRRLPDRPRRATRSPTARDGELLSATVGGATTTYTYDAFGRRTAARVDEVPLRQPGERVPGDRDGRRRRRRHDLLLRRDDRLFAAERGGERYYVGTDAVGSPRLVVRASDGSVVRKVTYDAFGVETAVTRRVRPADRLRRRPARRGHRARALRRARLRPGRRALHRERPDVLPRQRGEPLQLRQQQPDHAEGPVGPRAAAAGRCTRRSAAASSSAATTSSTGAPTGRSASRAASAAAAALDVDAVGGAQDTGAAVFAEVTGKLGMVGGTIGGELDLGCMNGQGSARRSMYGSGTVGIDTAGGVLGRRRPERPADAGRPPRGQDRPQGLQEVRLHLANERRRRHGRGPGGGAAQSIASASCCRCALLRSCVMQRPRIGPMLPMGMSRSRAISW